MLDAQLVFQHLLGSNMPIAKFLDMQTDTANLTTYTFSAVNIGHFSGTNSLLDTLGTDASTARSQERKVILVCIHAEDALTAFTVSSCTIGGQTGIIRIDSGGIQTVTTAIAAFTTEQLSFISNTDVVVTFSEAVQTCAIGVIELTNIGQNIYFRNNTGQGTGEIVISADCTPVNCEIGVFSLYASTCATASGAEEFRWRSIDSLPQAGTHPELLYEGSNAEMSYGAVWQYCRQWNGVANSWAGGVAIDWSSTGITDVASVHYG